VKAMILAAGVGERMRPLTEHTPKPLLQVGGRALLDYHLAALAEAGVRDVIINASHLGEQIAQYCGDGERWALRIELSFETAPLETAGGILQALDLLGEAPFMVVNGDVWTDFPFSTLNQIQLRDAETARLVMIDNPAQHPMGDFVLDQKNWLAQRAEPDVGLTYAGLGIYSRAFFREMAPGKQALRPLLDRAIEERSLGGHYYDGRWEDVGTPERLMALDTLLKTQAN